MDPKGQREYKMKEGWWTPKILQAGVNPAAKMSYLSQKGKDNSEGGTECPEGRAKVYRELFPGLEA